MTARPTIEPPADGIIGDPDPALFPARDERVRLDDILTRTLADAHEAIAVGPVVPDFDRATFERELAAHDFAGPRPVGEVAAWTAAQLQHGVVHMTHPRYFGLYNPCPTFPAQAADRLVATFNPQLASAVTSPAAAAIEAHVIRALAVRAGLPAGSGGHFTSGGSEANCTAVICALTQASPGFAEYGARALAGPPVFYVSRDSHLAWIKIGHLAGIGRAAARMVPTDGQGRMDPEALRTCIEADRAAGCVPFMIAATAGTTNAGMIDPLTGCARIARDYGLWYHVDAAWAGALLASDLLACALDGIEHATSITIDAHKWFATTMGCGMFITRHPAALHAAFHVAASFMPPNAVSLDPYVTTMQWSRRFLGIRLFMALAAAGWEGYARHVERAVAVARRIAGLLTALGWQVANDSPAAVLSLVPPARLGTPRSIVDRVVAAGTAWVSVAAFEGRDVIRVCVTHGATSGDDIHALVAALNAPPVS